MQTVIFRALQGVMPFVGLWFGFRAYTWLSEHPSTYEPLSGAVCLGLAVWVLGGALCVILSDAVFDAYADAKQVRARSTFYAMLISTASLVISILTYLSK